jgi:hypothetical protein
VSDCSQNADSTPPAAQQKAPGLTRRRFLGASGKKALYLTPVVLTLSAQQASAGSGPACGSAYKHTVGSPCETSGRNQCCPTDDAGNALECHTYQDNVTMTCQPPGSLL